MKNTPKRHFIRKIENFICENCGTEVIGDGYTNHCPKCLYSKHVDLIVPGDRENSCGGLMKPIEIEVKNDSYYITQKCQKCGQTGRIKAVTNDDFEAILRVAKACADKKS